MTDVSPYTALLRYGSLVFIVYKNQPISDETYTLYDELFDIIMAQNLFIVFLAENEIHTLPAPAQNDTYTLESLTAYYNIKTSKIPVGHPETYLPASLYSDMYMSPKQHRCLTILGSANVLGATVPHNSADHNIPLILLEREERQESNGDVYTLRKERRTAQKLLLAQGIALALSLKNIGSMRTPMIDLNRDRKVERRIEKQLWRERAKQQNKQSNKPKKQQRPRRR